MRLHVHKKGIRVLGVAESFLKEKSTKAVLAGVVMRGDFQIDGFCMTGITVKGLDGTSGVIRLFRDLDRTDINVIMLNGCIISLFNLVDLERVFEKTSIPVVCVTYEESGGLEKYFEEFENSSERLEIYKRLGPRVPIKLHTGHEVFVRFVGIGKENKENEEDKEREVRALLDKFTIQGAVPEPLKVARLFARTVMRMAEDD